ncbi:ornithine cyclodeaminase family protein [Microbacterium sp. 18062]|uniref:ornithine cyclodeaminase family protein n=1 Tax=Microbacterium sp. 18062 TaxID=2681410 RepID=UPI001358FD8B|nr:ornithine cyclodeaminase family protein [Microbacterium sp. 18062]
MPALTDLSLIDAQTLRAALPLTEAIAAIRDAASLGTDAFQRSAVDTAHGQFLLMPSELSGYAGCKVLTVAPGNPSRGLDRIQGVFLLFDGDTLEPRAIIDGAELTSLRTPAVTAAIVDLVTPADARTLTVFGTGPQARHHVRAMREIRPIERVRVVGRTEESSRRAADAWSDADLDIRAGSAAEGRDADIVICATSAVEPLFGTGVDARTTVAAVGSHEPTKRELPGALLGSSHVIVESLTVATTEAGDVIQAIDEGHLRVDDLISFQEVATGAVSPGFDRSRVVKTCGMGWQDLVVAVAAMERIDDGGRRGTGR